MTAERPLKRVLLIGATGTIGRSVRQALLSRGFHIACPVRPMIGAKTETPEDHRVCDITDLESLRRHGFQGEKFDVVISCLASRTGAPEEAWAIDYQTHKTLLKAAELEGVAHFVLLSAICVQKPKLQFQYAKLEFEKLLQQSSITHSIIRPTAFFKSISGQVERVCRGKPYILFGDGKQTACKPISNVDLATFIVDCLDLTDRHNQVLPIGGPGPALTPLAQGEMLFRLLGKEPRYRYVPIGLMSGIIHVLSLLGKVSKEASDAAELARIGHYYATESMLLWNPETNQYDPNATPEFGGETLETHYREILESQRFNERVSTKFF